MKIFFKLVLYFSLGFFYFTVSSNAESGAIEPTNSITNSVENNFKPNIKIVVGEEEINILSYDLEKQLGVAPMPDLHQTYLKYPDKTNYFWLSGHEGTRLLTTKDFTKFSAKLENGQAVKLFGPSNPSSKDFDADYAAPGSVFRSANNDLIMIYHGENHYGRTAGPGPFYASIGLARSHDHGKNWIRQGQIISGREVKPITAPNNRIGTGAGNPAAIIANKYIYVFFNDSTSVDGPFQGKNQLCLARASIDKSGKIGEWKKYYQGSFNQPGIGGLCEQTVENPPSASGARYINNADISYNKHLKSYLLVVNSDDGFFYSTSNDLIHWTQPKLLLQHPPRVQALKTPGAEYYYYPTLISPNMSSEQNTDATGYLFYAKGVQDTNLSQSKHSWYRKSFRISRD